MKCDTPQEHNPEGSEVTKHGRWVFKEANVHKCLKPGYDKSVKAGDRWQCNDCDKVWTVKRVGYDQRDNTHWLEWDDGSTYNGIYAPGTK